MTPEERYAKIDRRLDNKAMHLEATASMMQTHDVQLDDVQLDKAAHLLAKVSDTMDWISRIMESH